MRLIISSDWQCALTNLDRCERLVEQIVQLGKKSSKTHATYFAHLGDVKEFFNPIDQRVTNFIVSAFTRIQEVYTGILFVRGNHDSITTQDRVPSCVPVLESVITRGQVADKDWTFTAIRLRAWRPDFVKYVLIYMVPYFRDMELQKKAFKDAYTHARKPEYKDPTSTAVGKDNVKILLFHNTITGCRQNLYTKGEGLTAEDIGAKYYEICLSGHIHIPQILKPNIHYVGSSFPCDWSEVNFEHRLLQLTIDDK